MSYRDLLKIEHPDYINKGYMGWCRGCPGMYWDGAPKLFESCNLASPEKCAKCWDNEVPASIPAPRVQFNINEMQKGEKEMEPRNFSTMATMTEAPRKPRICENMQELHKILLEVHNKTEALAHLLFGGEVPTCSLASEPSCFADDVFLTKEVALAIMSKLVMIEEKL